MKILVTAGNTQTPVDRVRCITNVFSGRTGARIALAAHDRGHAVTLLTSQPGVVRDLGSIDERFMVGIQSLVDRAESERIKERMGRAAYDIALKNGDIELLPLEVMRGRSLKNAFVLLDEAQNCTVTEIKTFVMDSPGREYVLVKVLTDEGIHGWGEGTLERKQRTVAAAVGDLTPFVIGQDPTRVDHLWQRMYRHGFWRGGVAILSALSAIEQALWDITCKAYGQPVYKLLGGDVRDYIPCYTHTGNPDQARQFIARASLRLTRWLQSRLGIRTRNVIGHNESLSSPYHHERVPSLRTQTHDDWTHADMRIYRRHLKRRALAAGVPIGPRPRWVHPNC